MRSDAPDFPHTMKTWIGTSGFQYAEWKGSFYPEKLSLAKMLGYYGERFPTTEINYSFRQIPSEKAIARWDAETPARFKFAFKAPQRVTHFARLRDCGEIMGHFDGVVAALGDKLGPVLFQLPPDFKKDGPLLDDFLQSLPDGLKAAFEFRHESWFSDDTYDRLRTRRAALCLAESEELITPRITTTDFGYLRLRKVDYTPAALRDWRDFIREQTGAWRDAFIYFKHEDTGTGPVFAEKLKNVITAEP